MALPPRLLLLLLGASGCSLHTTSPGDRPPDATPPGLRYAFAVRDSIRSEVLDTSGAPVSVPGLATETLGWDGELELSAARTFRDDSLGWLVRLGSVHASAEGGRPPEDPSGLSLELRAFRSREILAVDLLDHLVGGPRHADLLLPLLVLLSPAVPEVAVGVTAPRRMNLPMLPEPGRGIRTAWDLSWTRLEDERDAGGHCLAFRWSGPVHGQGNDGGEDWAARYRVSGTASGETCLGVEDFHPVRGSLSWEVSLDVLFAESAGDGSYVPRGTLRQQHAWTGRIARTGGAP